MFLRSREKQKGTSPGTSPFPPLSAERIAAARRRYGSAIDPYLKHLHLGDPIADELILHFEKLPRGVGFGMLSKALKNGIETIDNPPKPFCPKIVYTNCANKVRNGPSSADQGYSIASQKQLPCTQHLYLTFLLVQDLSSKRIVPTVTNYMWPKFLLQLFI